MHQRHQSNPNLILVNDPEWNGMPLLRGRVPYAESYLTSIHNTLNQSIDEHRRVTAIRFDLRLPAALDSPDSRVITRFFESLKAQLRAHEEAKRRAGIRVHQAGVRYVWAKEQSISHNAHYHCCIFLNRDAYHCLGSFAVAPEPGSRAANMAQRIQAAWASALGLPADESIGLVHFPTNGVYQVDANSDEFIFQVIGLLKRLSYLAKIDTKRYENGYRCFGRSRA